MTEETMSTSSESESDVVVINHEDTSDLNSENILPQSPEAVELLRNWLQPTSYDIAGGEYRKHLSSYVHGTGAWVTSSRIYRDWITTDRYGLLWMRGIPGSGKSVMAAKLVDEIKKTHPDCPVLYFFFRQIIKANHHPQALLRDWMHQLLPYSPPLQKKLMEYQKNRRYIDSFSMEDLWNDLRIALGQLPGAVFCVADALDEIDQDNEPFLQALGKLGQYRPGKVKVLITSRPVPHVEGPLRTIPAFHLRLEEDVVDMDIATYVQHALSKSTIPESSWPKIAYAVPGRANGLFLYAKLAMDAFLKPGADIETVLSKLPEDLNILYTDLLEEHAKRSRIAPETQDLILRGVTHAMRPLRLLELAEMVRVISPDGTTRDLKATKELIRAACGPLLEILADETVSVVHHSFTEYLNGSTRKNDSRGYPVLHMGTTHAQLAIACLRYLNGGCLGGVTVTIDSESTKLDYYLEEKTRFHPSQGVPSDEVAMRLRHPFFEYAASNWSRHINRAELVGHSQDELDEVLDDFLLNPRTIKPWLQMRWPARAKGAVLVSKLHVAAKMGLYAYTKKLLKHMNPDLLDVRQRTPLWWAASEGFADVVRLLVDAGADPNHAEPVDGLKPLHKAASKNHHEVVKVLLKAGVDPLTPKTNEEIMFWGNGRSSVGDTPLMYTCRRGHLESLDAFMPLSINNTYKALKWAAESGQASVVEKLLHNRDVDVDHLFNGFTALYQACAAFSTATVKVLLQAGANPNIVCYAPLDEDEDDDDDDNNFSGSCPESRQEISCLQKFCNQIRYSHRRPENSDELRTILSLLLEAGVNIQQRSPDGSTPLHRSVEAPYLTRMLLEAGADANVADDKGLTPLHYAKSAEAVSLLVEVGGADPNILDKTGKIPLVYFLQDRWRTPNSDLGVVVKFLEYGSKCELADENGNSALHFVLAHSTPNLDTVKALLAAGADPNQRNHAGLTPMLHSGLSDTCPDAILDALIEAGADINARDNDGATLLFLRVKAHRRKDFASLVNRGASLTTRDYQGRTLLHAFLGSRNHGNQPLETQPNLDFLVDAGLDIKATDYQGNNLLHELALCCRLDESRESTEFGYWGQLLGLGLCLEDINHEGQTPLHLFCKRVDVLELSPCLPLNFVLAKCKSVDMPDNCGVMPLHIASTTSTIFVKKLLDAGADPASITNEGLTPLHLAARSGQSNNVGHLLDALKRKRAMVSCDPDRSRLENTNSVPGVNARAWGKNIRPTPLHYACKSGRPESVALLLAAGADATDPDLMNICADFDESISERAFDPNSLRLDKTQDTQCSNAGSLTEKQTTRLEEVMEMLTKAGAKLFLSGWSWQHFPSLKQKPYFLSCWEHYQQPESNTYEYQESSPDANWKKAHVAMLEYRKAASVEALKDSAIITPGCDNHHRFIDMLIHREYYLIEELLAQGCTFLPLPGHRTRSNLAVLIENGFYYLLDKVGMIAAKSRFQDQDWHAFGNPDQPGLWFAKRNLEDTDAFNPEPFLLIAARRRLPNMEVMQLLVERFGVDINEQGFLPSSKNNTYRMYPFESPMSYLSGGREWWHVHQAIPYLIEKGAKLNICDKDGKTPLHTAISSTGPFARDAVNALVKAGANVNATDKEGKSCLTYASVDLNMFKLLVANGAEISADTLERAISAKNAEVVELILSTGLHPDTPKLGRDTDNRETPLWRTTVGFKLKWVQRPPNQYDVDFKVYSSIIKSLLNHGANVFHRFRRGGDSKEYTVLHDILERGAIPESFLWLPELDVNHRDLKGRTLLHAASCSVLGLDYILRPKGKGSDKEEDISVFKRLLAYGVDLRAEDNDGENVLHYLARKESIADAESSSLAFAQIVDLAPDVVNQRDKKGNTPLMLSIGDSSKVETAKHLLSVGADPLLTNSDGDSVLHILASSLFNDDRCNLFKHLVRRGVNINARNARGRTPLFSFSFLPRKENSPASRWYWNRIKENDSGLFGGPIAMMEALGANFLARDNEGQNVLHIAARGYVTRFQELMARGLDPMAEDDSQRTAIDVAAACANLPVLELFEKKT